ncbi:GAF domain-containing protein [Desulfosporosinus hippei]|uniref:histidine kinase n=1 Tax=Desulfosporosinus hippei DSM 8344 TaxID=1121419 RepID=A0A1G8L273_9FIRM|nr:GAF domain-containing protein [Desulfosporosinus hippei]SDI49782.1 PAS domain S-box-containing protein [Desulfosporosinus hippei DSM 8344]
MSAGFNIGQLEGLPYILLSNSIILEAGERFLELIVYRRSEIVNKGIDYLYSLLRFNVYLDDMHENQKSFFIFTKYLEPRKVKLTIHTGYATRTEKIFIFEEEPRSRIEQRFPYIEQQFKYNLSGFAIFQAEDFLLLKANQLFLDFQGEPFNKPETSIGMSLHQICIGWSGSNSNDEWQKVVDTGIPLVNKEFAYEGLNRGTTYWDVMVMPILEDGKVEFLVETVREVTQDVLKSKQIEDQNTIIQRQKDQWETILNNTQEALFVFDKEGKYIIMNKIAKERFSTSLDKIGDSSKVTKFYDLKGNKIPLENTPNYRVKCGEVVKDEILTFKLNGQEFYSIMSGTPIFDKNGDFLYGVISSRNITELIKQKKEVEQQKEQLDSLYEASQKTEQALKNQKEELEVIIDNMSEGLSVVDKHGNYIRVNKKVKEYTQKSTTLKDTVNCIGQSLDMGEKYYNAAGSPLSLEDFPAYKVINGEKVENQRVIIKRGSGNTIYYDFNASPIFDDDTGEVRLGIIHNRDVTEKVRNENIIKEQKEMLEAVIENMNDAIAIFDGQGNCILRNAEARRMYPDLSIETKYESIHDGFECFDLDNNIIAAENLPTRRVFKGERIRNERIIVKYPNKSIFVEINAVPVFDDENNLTLAVVTHRDISQMMQYEEKIKEQKELLEVELSDTKLLQSVSIELLRKDNVLTLYEKIIDAAMQIMHSQYASLQMVLPGQGNSDKLQLLAFCGFKPEAAKLWELLDSKSACTTCCEALRTGRRIIVPNVQECGFMLGTKDQAMYLQTGINAVQSTPLRSRNGRLIGMISTHWNGSHEPTERELRHLDVLARQVADIIEQKQAEEKIRWNKEKAEILYEVTGKLLASDRPQEIVEELCLRIMKFLKCDTFFNYLIDEEKMCLHLNACAGIPKEMAHEIEWLDYGVAVCGCVARDGCRIVAENIQSSPDIRTELVKSFGIRAYACHPLMDQQKIIGTLSFGTKSKDSFNEDELALMKAVVDQVAISMNRIRTEEVLRNQQQLMIKVEREKNEALEKAIKMKDEFLGTISHEFRTPLNVINAALQVIENLYGDHLHDKVKKHLKKIKVNTYRQMRLVSNLLDITRYNAGHLKMTLENRDIIFISNAIIKSVESIAKEKGIQLIFSTDTDCLEMAIDEEKYERILLNLLSNAIKFTPRGKSIWVNISSQNKKAVIMVKDEGVGIPKNKQKLIFERFGQVDNSLTRQAEGTGIGLSLVKTLVKGMGGKINVFSEIGKGSTFKVILPINQINDKGQGKLIIVPDDSRVLKAIAIEFSDLYLD